MCEQLRFTEESGAFFPFPALDDLGGSLPTRFLQLCHEGLGVDAAVPLLRRWLAQPRSPLPLSAAHKLWLTIRDEPGSLLLVQLSSQLLQQLQGRLADASLAWRTTAGCTQQQQWAGAFPPDASGGSDSDAEHNGHEVGEVGGEESPEAEAAQTRLVRSRLPLRHRVQQAALAARAVREAAKVTAYLSGHLLLLAGAAGPNKPPGAGRPSGSGAACGSGSDDEDDEESDTYDDDSGGGGRHRKRDGSSRRRGSGAGRSRGRGLIGSAGRGQDARGRGQAQGRGAAGGSGGAGLTRPVGPHSSGEWAGALAAAAACLDDVGRLVWAGVRMDMQPVGEGEGEGARADEATMTATAERAAVVRLTFESAIEARALEQMLVQPLLMWGARLPAKPPAAQRVAWAPLRVHLAGLLCSAATAGPVQMPLDGSNSSNAGGGLGASLGALCTCSFQTIILELAAAARAAAATSAGNGAAGAGAAGRGRGGAAAGSAGASGGPAVLTAAAAAAAAAANLGSLVTETLLLAFDRDPDSGPAGLRLLLSAACAGADLLPGSASVSGGGGGDVAAGAAKATVAGGRGGSRKRARPAAGGGAGSGGAVANGGAGVGGGVCGGTPAQRALLAEVLPESVCAAVLQLQSPVVATAVLSALAPSFGAMSAAGRKALLDACVAAVAAGAVAEAGGVAVPRPDADGSTPECVWAGWAVLSSGCCDGDANVRVYALARMAASLPAIGAGLVASSAAGQRAGQQQHPEQHSEQQPELQQQQHVEEVVMCLLVPTLRARLLDRTRSVRTRALQLLLELLQLLRQPRPAVAAVEGGSARLGAAVAREVFGEVCALLDAEHGSALRDDSNAQVLQQVVGALSSALSAPDLLRLVLEEEEAQGEDAGGGLGEEVEVRTGAAGCSSGAARHGPVAISPRTRRLLLSGVQLPAKPRTPASPEEEPETELYDIVVRQLMPPQRPSRQQQQEGQAVHQEEGCWRPSQAEELAAAAAREHRLGAALGGTQLHAVLWRHSMRQLVLALGQQQQQGWPGQGEEPAAGRRSRSWVARAEAALRVLGCLQPCGGVPTASMTLASAGPGASGGAGGGNSWPRLDTAVGRSGSGPGVPGRSDVSAAAADERDGADGARGEVLLVLRVLATVLAAASSASPPHGGSGAGRSDCDMRRSEFSASCHSCLACGFRLLVAALPEPGCRPRPGSHGAGVPAAAAAAAAAPLQPSLAPAAVAAVAGRQKGHVRFTDDKGTASATAAVQHRGRRECCLAVLDDSGADCTRGAGGGSGGDGSSKGRSGAAGGGPALSELLLRFLDRSAQQLRSAATAVGAGGPPADAVAATEPLSALEALEAAYAALAKCPGATPVFSRHLRLARASLIQQRQQQPQQQRPSCQQHPLQPPAEHQPAADGHGGHGLPPGSPADPPTAQTPAPGLIPAPPTAPIPTAPAPVGSWAPLRCYLLLLTHMARLYEYERHDIAARLAEARRGHGGSGDGGGGWGLRGGSSSSSSGQGGRGASAVEAVAAAGEQAEGAGHGMDVDGAADAAAGADGGRSGGAGGLPAAAGSVGGAGAGGEGGGGGGGGGDYMREAEEERASRGVAQRLLERLMAESAPASHTRVLLRMLGLGNQREEQALGVGLERAVGQAAGGQVAAGGRGAVPAEVQVQAMRALGRLLVLSDSLAELHTAAAVAAPLADWRRRPVGLVAAAAAVAADLVLRDPNRHRPLVGLLETVIEELLLAATAAATVAATAAATTSADASAEVAGSSRDSGKHAAVTAEAGLAAAAVLLPPLVNSYCRLLATGRLQWSAASYRTLARCLLPPPWLPRRHLVAHPVAALLLLATGQAPSAASTAARGGSLSQADGGGEGDGAAGGGSGWGGGTGRRVSVALGLLRNCPPPLQVQLVVEVLLPSAAALGGSSSRVAGGGSSTGDGGRGGAGRMQQLLLPPPLLLPSLLRPADLHSDDLALPAIQAVCSGAGVAAPAGNGGEAEAAVPAAAAAAGSTAALVLLAEMTPSARALSAALLQLQAAQRDPWVLAAFTPHTVHVLRGYVARYQPSVTAAGSRSGAGAGVAEGEAGADEVVVQAERAGSGVGGAAVAGDGALAMDGGGQGVAATGRGLGGGGGAVAAQRRLTELLGQIGNRVATAAALPLKQRRQPVDSAAGAATADPGAGGVAGGAAGGVEDGGHGAEVAAGAAVAQRYEAAVMRFAADRLEGGVIAGRKRPPQQPTFSAAASGAAGHTTAEAGVHASGQHGPARAAGGAAAVARGPAAMDEGEAEDEHEEEVTAPAPAMRRAPKAAAKTVVAGGGVARGGAKPPLNSARTGAVIAGGGADRGPAGGAAGKGPGGGARRR